MSFSHEDYFHIAADEAKKALCKRGKCGAIVVLNGVVIGKGFNSPAGKDIHQSMCHLNFGESKKPKSDRTCCMHAEWRAIIQAIKESKNIEGSILYFIRVDDEGKMLFSGNPYCTVCSRLALDCGIAYFGLWHEKGYKLYPTKEYNTLSYAFHVNE